METLKNIKAEILGLAIILISIPGFGNSGGDQKAALNTPKKDVVLQGIIAHREKEIEEIVINVYSKNKLVESIITNGKGKFKTSLSREEDYTIEIVANGFYNKRFKVLTTDIGPDETPSPIDFNATLVHKDEIEGGDDFLLDFPWAIFTFHGKKKEFKLHQRYTKQMIRDINLIYHEASLNATD